MPVFPELEQVAIQELRSWFLECNGAHLRHVGEEELWLQEVAAQIATNHRGVSFLLSCIPGASADRLRAILVGLAVGVDKMSASQREETAVVARRLLKDRRPMVVAEAVDLLNQLNDSKPRTAILRLIRHDSPYVVGAVLRYMARQYPHEAVSILHKALASKEPIVRQNAIDELDDLNCKEALPAIKRLLRDPDKHVRQAARSAVKNLDSA